MKKIYTYNVKPGYRNLTVADIKANKGVKKLTQVNAKNAEEAYAAGVANIDMLICDSNNVEKVTLESTLFSSILNAFPIIF